MTVPYTFATQVGSVPLVQLDDNFTAVGQAANIANTPAGNIVATTVQAAINELDGEKVQSATLVASGGSALVGYLPSGTGAVTSTVQTKLRESTSVKDFGAIGNGVADDTAAIQAAITAVQGSNVSLFFPAGTYKVSASLNITAAVSFVGYAAYGTSITWSNVNLTVFNVNTNNPVTWQNFTFFGPASPLSGSVIALTGPTGNINSVVLDCSFISTYNAIDCTAAYALKVVSCYFNTFVNYGVHIQNTYNVDAGDSSIVNCIFAGPSGGSNVCVYQRSSGGLRLTSNKFNTGDYNYKLSLATAASTSDLIVVGNSFENAKTANIQLTTNSSGAFSEIVITGNQFALAPINILADNTYFNGISRGTISGNTFSLSPLGTACISLNYVTLFNINGNVFNAAAAVTPTGILATVNVSGLVGNNLFSSSVWGAKVNNASGNLFVLPNRVVTGLQAVTCSAGFGSLWSASGTVTFPITFAATPVVTTSPNNISGGIAVSVYSVSTTGFSYTAVSVTNGGAGSFSYTASGLF